METLTLVGANGDYNVEDAKGRVFAIIQSKSYNRPSARWSVSYNMPVEGLPHLLNGSYTTSTLKAATALVAKVYNMEVN